MKDENKQPSASFKESMNNMVKGCVVGGSVVTTISPLLGWTNITIEAKNKAIEQAVKANPTTTKVPKVSVLPLVFNRRIFAGTTSYVTSVAPNAAVTITAKNILSTNYPDTGGEGLASYSAGFAAGLIVTPFEAIAQTSTFTKGLTKKEIALKINGVNALMRGAISLGLREGVWAFTYLAAPKRLGIFLEEKGMESTKANMLGAFTAGGAFGLISCPINQIRFNLQSNLTVAGKTMTYPEHIKNLWQRAPKVSTARKSSFFFSGGVPRTIASAGAALLMSEGMKYFDEHIQNNHP